MLAPELLQAASQARPFTCFYSLGVLSTFLLPTVSLALLCMSTSFLKPNKILKAQDTGSVCLE